MNGVTIESVDHKLGRLEDDLVLYDAECQAFVGGDRATPPFERKRQVDAAIKLLFGERDMSFEQRFRYDRLVARYTALSDSWRRALREGHRGGSAPAPVDAPAPARAAIRCADPATEPSKMRALFEELVRAKRSFGEPTDGITYELFADTLCEKVRGIRALCRCDEVELAIEVTDRVHFRARPIGPEGTDRVRRDQMPENRSARDRATG